MKYFKHFIIVAIFLVSITFKATEYHVAKNGSDFNIGSKEAPFKTISKAAKIALPGDVITVHKGIYREWINPLNGGFNRTNRIVYQAAENERVQIKGSEVVNTWKKHKGNVWKVVLDNNMFGDFNPYQEVLNGDWITDKYGREHHLGEVYLNEKSLYEIDSLHKVFKENPLERAVDQNGSKYKWYCKSTEETTTIYANFGGVNPNKELVEINVRPTVFFPKKTGINYITVRGFHLSQAATQWAPPTAEQIGLIGPNWSKGWVIENNIISDSKCAGIVIGKERASGENLWTKSKLKHGTQREREVVFKALQLGWSKEMIGSHIIRNNIIRDCEQGGIIGHMGCVFSEITHNEIYNINVKRQFGGWEIGGIKLHAAIDVLIKNNFIHDNYRGIWLDWQAQGAQVTGNLLFNNSSSEDLFIEVNHGPLIIDNNILLSNLSLLNASQGTAIVNNLMMGKIQTRAASNRFTHYHFPHSTKVMGLMTIILGDDRFYNNIFAFNGKLDKGQYSGLNAYSDFPTNENPEKYSGSLNKINKQKFPMDIEANLYLNKALPSNIEKNSIENRTLHPNVKLIEENDGYYLSITVDESFFNVNTLLVNTELLGTAIQSEMPFENRDESSITLDKDFFGKKRNSLASTVGPFKDLKLGENKIKVWPK